jgi:hypothetical protein
MPVPVHQTYLDFRSHIASFIIEQTADTQQTAEFNNERVPIGCASRTRGGPDHRLPIKERYFG